MTARPRSVAAGPCSVAADTTDRAFVSHSQVFGAETKGARRCEFSASLGAIGEAGLAANRNAQ